MLEINDIVYYTDNGRHDTGIVMEVSNVNPEEVCVTWDDDNETDWYHARMLTFVKKRFE